MLINANDARLFDESFFTFTGTIFGGVYYPPNVTKVGMHNKRRTSTNALVLRSNLSQ